LLGATGYCADAVFRGIETKTGGEQGDVCAAYRCAETFYWGQNLLVEVVVDVWLEFAVRLEHFVDRVSVFCRIFC